MLSINKDYFYEKLEHLLKTDSPSGFTMSLMHDVKQWTEALGYDYEVMPKGTTIISVPGKSSKKTVALSAHIDTLGAMVRSITANGTLKFTLVGGPIVPTLDGEYCRIHTRDGSVYTGTFLSTSPAIHVYKDATTLARTPETMEVRLDCEVSSKEDVSALGIENGDFICIEPKAVFTNGFVKSRFLDDKASVACLFGVLESFSRTHTKPDYDTKIIISVYEEVGHGAAYLPPEISEVLAVDMGCIGDDLSCTEYDVSICPKDSSGPYDYEMTSKLINAAKSNKIRHAIDIYPYYGSDVSASLKGGNNIKGALIGPGVHASHGMERTHYSALEATMQLVGCYLCENITPNTSDL